MPLASAYILDDSARVNGSEKNARATRAHASAGHQAPRAETTRTTPSSTGRTSTMATRRLHAAPAPTTPRPHPARRCRPPAWPPRHPRAPRLRNAGRPAKATAGRARPRRPAGWRVRPDANRLGRPDGCGSRDAAAGRSTRPITGRTATGRGARAAEGAGLENRLRASVRGFESHPLRSRPWAAREPVSRHGAAASRVRLGSFAGRPAPLRSPDRLLTRSIRPRDRGRTRESPPNRSDARGAAPLHPERAPRHVKAAAATAVSRG